MPKKCSLRIVGDNGKILRGTAAQLHYISDRGGWDSFIEEIADNSARVAVKHAFKELMKSSFVGGKGKKSS